jgi:hypothetical protein
MSVVSLLWFALSSPVVVLGSPFYENEEPILRIMLGLLRLLCRMICGRRILTSAEISCLLDMILAEVQS